MAIPDFQSTMLPLLQFLSDGNEHSNRDILDALENQFDMTEEEQHRLLPSGKQRIFVNRLAWAKSHLKQAGLIASRKRGYFIITDRGMHIISEEKPDAIGINFLMQYPDYVAFRQGKKNGENAPTQESDQSISCEQENTPEEDIERGLSAITEGLKQEIMASILGCSYRFFEQLVIDLLLAMGYGGSRKEAGMLTRKGSDEGIDGIINEDKLGLDTIYVQAKKWTHTVSRPEIQKFSGALQGKRAKKGIYITTSQFSKEAYAFTQNIESKIILIDGDRLAELMIEHHVGVTIVQTFHIQKIDTDYFIEA
ncbi:restriction endonuclease [Desulfovibrio inopinatus]|uniref:restriction endonuclease n=1 Tax=Desulfovibrio inopinatus TaxID=102109 RepID=UPI0004248F97|nr:restriction endonuclease [Desulfovibrio inopinatus]